VRHLRSDAYSAQQVLLLLLLLISPDSPVPSMSCHDISGVSRHRHSHI